MSAILHIRFLTYRPISIVRNITKAYLSTKSSPAPTATTSSSQSSTANPKSQTTTEPTASPDPTSPTGEERPPPTPEEKALRLRRLHLLAQHEARQAASLKAALGERDGGGSAGIEYEDGLPVAMKRGVRENMFRLI